MIKVEEMDENIPFRKQLQTETGAVVLLNKFVVAPGDEEQLLRAWSLDAKIIKQAPGLISIQLHRGVGGSTVFINYAIWESMKAYRDFIASGLLATSGSQGLFPASVKMSPHLFEKVAVAGICVA